MSKYYFEIGTIMMKVMKRLMTIDQKKIKVQADKEGFTLRESFFIVELGSHDFMTFGDIEKYLEIDRKTLTALIAKLNKKTVIEKRAAETDKRCTYIVLTEKGRRVREELLEQASALMNFAVNDLTINEEMAVLKFFSKLLQTTVRAPEIETFSKE
ncbi:MAG: MarR family transcriptional regulator [Clostridia bacterium]|nr:MarR family transcriptional regulator [Clostridia bacterium]